MLLSGAELASCRHSQPPEISIICILDGFGGGDCVNSIGEKIYRAPSEMTNFWATTQGDMANFSSWCYDTNPKNVERVMQGLSGRIMGQ